MAIGGWENVYFLSTSEAEMVVKINNIFCGLIRLVGVFKGGGWCLSMPMKIFSTVGIFFPAVMTHRLNETWLVLITPIWSERSGYVWCEWKHLIFPKGEAVWKWTFGCFDKKNYYEYQKILKRWLRYTCMFEVRKRIKTNW